MTVKHLSSTNTYMVVENGKIILEVSDNMEKGCLEVTHYGSHETAVQTIFSPQFNLEVEIEKPADKDFERVIIRTGFDTVSWEHCVEEV